MNDPKGILDEVKKAVVGKDGVLVMALLRTSPAWARPPWPWPSARP